MMSGHQFFEKLVSIEREEDQHWTSALLQEAGQQREPGGPALDLCPSAGSWSAVRRRRTSAGLLSFCRKQVSSEKEEDQRWTSVLLQEAGQQ